MPVLRFTLFLLVANFIVSSISLREIYQYVGQPCDVSWGVQGFPVTLCECQGVKIAAYFAPNHDETSCFGKIKRQGLLSEMSKL